MNMLKRNLSIICIISMMLSISVFTANAAITTIEDFTVDINTDNSTLSIEEYNGDGGEVIIKDELSGYTVDKISSRAFLNCADITSITLPRFLRTIGSYAFSGCSGIASITINDAVSSVGNYAFYDCTSLESADIKGNMTAISQYMFYDCTSLNNVTLPTTLRVIYESAFRNCSSLKSITIPDEVNTIGESAFYNSGLEKITIGRNVTTIGKDAFLKCAPNLVISGYTGSTAETYCKENNIKFFPLDTVYGDVNNDERINVKDVTYIQKFLAGLESAGIEENSKSFYAADVSGDGNIDIGDALLVLRFVDHEISVFPVEE